MYQQQPQFFELFLTPLSYSVVESVYLLQI